MQGLGSKNVWDFLPAALERSCEILASFFNLHSPAKSKYAN